MHVEPADEARRTSSGEFRSCFVWLTVVSRQDMVPGTQAAAAGRRMTEAGWDVRVFSVSLYWFTSV